MVKKSVLMMIVFLLTWHLLAIDNPGITLLDNLLAKFKNMNETGIGDYNTVNKSLQALMAGVKKAKTQGQIDQVYFKRYSRILEIMKLAIMEKSYDPEGILDVFIMGEIDRFVEEVTFQKIASHDRGIEILSSAMVEEILNMYLYLECQGKRVELKKKVQDSFSAKK
jgi:hypothetical protein